MLTSTKIIIGIIGGIIALLVLAAVGQQHGNKFLETAMMRVETQAGYPLTILAVQERGDKFDFVLTDANGNAGIASVQKLDCHLDANLQLGTLLWQWKPQDGPDWFFGTAVIRFNANIPVEQNGWYDPRRETAKAVANDTAEQSVYVQPVRSTAHPLAFRTIHKLQPLPASADTTRRVIQHKPPYYGPYPETEEARRYRRAVYNKPVPLASGWRVDGADFPAGDSTAVETDSLGQRSSPFSVSDCRSEHVIILNFSGLTVDEIQAFSRLLSVVEEAGDQPRRPEDFDVWQAFINFIAREQSSTSADSL